MCACMFVFESMFVYTLENVKNGEMVFSRFFSLAQLLLL